MASRNTGSMRENTLAVSLVLNFPAMFCPQCHVEYRPGFTRCTDCDVDLVPVLPTAEDPVSKAPLSASNAGGSLRILWEGEDLALFENLLGALEAADIRYFDQPLGVYPGVRRKDPFPVQPLARFGYQVAVLSSDLGPARQILGKLLDEEPQDMELPAQDEERGESAAVIIPKEGGLNFEVWSGNEESLAEFLEAALKENGVPAQMEKRGTDLAIYIPDSMEAAAREIVREIVEGAPPNAGMQK